MSFSFKNKKGLKISIKWKLTFIITALMIGLINVLTWTHISAQKENMQKTFERNINLMQDNLIETGKILLKNLIINVEKDMAVLNFSGVFESLNTAIETNAAVKAMILMDNNRAAIFNSENSQLINTIMEDDISKQAGNSNGLTVIKNQLNYIEIVNHVQFSTKKWGHLRLILNLQPLFMEIKESEKQIQNGIYLIKKRTFINAFIFMIISFIIVYFISFRITKKIINLTHSAVLISKGKFSIQIQQSSTNDEIAILQRSFKIMASNLNFLIKRLDKYNKKLKSIVDERTKELKLSEEKYKGLYNSSKDGIFYINMDNTFQNANFAFSKLTGYSSKHLSNLKLDDLIENKYSYKIGQVFNEIKQKGFSQEIEINICHKSGKLVPVEIHAWLRNDNTGKPDGIWGFARDISERKLAEKIREDVEKMIQHDIKTPLNAIIGLSNLIRESHSMDRNSIKHIDDVKKLALDSIKLINYSLNIRKIEMGNYQLQAVDCDLISMLFRLKIEFLTMINEKKLKIDYLFENNIINEGSNIKCFVRGEDLLLNNLFRNLIKNAIEASPQNETIMINILKTDKKIEIQINNKGVLAENIRSKFFEKYISSGKSNGTGLGTYSSKLLAKLHEGDITFRSSPAFGTTLIVSLPAYDLVEIIEKKNIEKENDKPDNYIYNKRFNVLIADDSANNRYIIGHAIESLTNWKIFFAVNGREAVEAFQSHQIDIILMDMKMPEYSGAEAIKLIRDIEKTNNNKVCIIVISADKTSDIEGADGYILKFFDNFDHLIENIIRVIKLTFTANI